MLENIGASGFIMIILIALLLFGPSKLPELGRAAGSTIREFKRAASGILADDEQEKKQVVKQDPPQEERINRGSNLPD